jgi:hypothetical protein
MLVFCMLLALSGTTDFPGNRPGGIPSSHALMFPQSRSQMVEGEALTWAERSPGASEGPGSVPGIAARGMDKGEDRNRSLLPLGVVLVALWVLVSFRLFSGARR